MNLQVNRSMTRPGADGYRLWQDGRVWVVNCTAVEGAWPEEVHRAYLREARRRRDQMLAAFLETW